MRPAKQSGRKQRIFKILKYYLNDIREKWAVKVCWYLIFSVLVSLLFPFILWLMLGKEAGELGLKKGIDKGIDSDRRAREERAFFEESLRAARVERKKKSAVPNPHLDRFLEIGGKQNQILDSFDSTAKFAANWSTLSPREKGESFIKFGTYLHNEMGQAIDFTVELFKEEIRKKRLDPSYRTPFPDLEKMIQTEEATKNTAMVLESGDMIFSVVFPPFLARNALGVVHTDSRVRTKDFILKVLILCWVGLSSIAGSTLLSDFIVRLYISPSVDGEDAVLMTSIPRIKRGDIAMSKAIVLALLTAFLSLTIVFYPFAAACLVFSSSISLLNIILLPIICVLVFPLAMTLYQGVVLAISVKYPAIAKFISKFLLLIPYALGFMVFLSSKDSVYNFLWFVRRWTLTLILIFLLLGLLGHWYYYRNYSRLDIKLGVPPELGNSR